MEADKENSKPTEHEAPGEDDGAGFKPTEVDVARFHSMLRLLGARKAEGEDKVAAPRDTEEVTRRAEVTADEETSGPLRAEVTAEEDATVILQAEVTVGEEANEGKLTETPASYIVEANFEMGGDDA